MSNNEHKGLGPYEQVAKSIELIDRRMTKAGLRVGLRPYETDYELVTDEQMVELIPYVMMPVHYRHWRYGKQALQEKKRAGTFHIFEAVLNTSPSICYLGTTNTLEMQALVMAHAKWGHVDFFANNKLFKETGASSVVNRFGLAKEKIDRLIADPNWGWEAVEAILDAAHALEDHVTWLPTIAQETDKEVRDAAMEQLRELRRRIADEGSRSSLMKELLEKEATELQGRLMRFPFYPTNDVLGFLADPANTPKLPEEAHMLLSIVRDQGLYFQPQGRTKFMNEGWASYWEKHLLLQPEMGFPVDMRLSLAKYWTMHDRQASNWYFDPYALGLRVFEYIDEKYGYDEGEAEMEVRPLVYVDENTVTESEEAQKVKYTVRNRDKMLEVRKHYDDNRFLEEFLNEELFEKINLKALEWVRRFMSQVNGLLRKNGWNPQLVRDPLPLTLEGLMEVVELWMNTAETTAQLHAQGGTPIFPVPPQILKEMGMVLQIVGAFDASPHKARRQLVLRTAYHSKPQIWIMDTGRRSDGVWTLKHEFDENFGPLMQSEARDTLKYFRRLCCEPARLITMEQRTDRQGRPSGPPAPYEYFTEDGITVKERFL